MNNNMKNELEQYIVELDSTIARMKNSEFPFLDLALAYEDVCNRLKDIIHTES